MQRHCNACGLDKGAGEFYPSVKTRCRDCCKAKALLKRPERLQYLKNWRASHHDAFKSYYAANKARRAAYWREWYEANKQKRAMSYAAWAKTNKHVVNALIAKRTAAKRHADVSWADTSAIKNIYAMAARLTKETGIAHEVDHIYPLQGEHVSGLHCEANLQVLTKTENIIKSNKMPVCAA